MYKVHEKGGDWWRKISSSLLLFLLFFNLVSLLGFLRSVQNEKIVWPEGISDNKKEKKREKEEEG